VFVTIFVAFQAPALVYKQASLTFALSLVIIDGLSSVVFDLSFHEW